MGCDGGTIPRRDELVKTKKKPEKVERDIENAAKWKYCTLTQIILREPIVACYLGRLFNKESVIEALLAKTIGDNENGAHIRNLKDIKTLNLTKNSSFDESKVDKGAEFKDYNIAQFICPVVGIEMNGKHRFCIIWSCGCVVSERAMKEVKSDVCHKCGKPYKEEDVIVLNGTDAEVELYRKRRDERGSKAAKPKKQAASSESTTANGKETTAADDSKPSTSGVSSSTSSKLVSSSGGGTATIPKSKPDGIKGAAGSSKRKDDSNDSSMNGKKSKTSVQDDPKASKVFKSLFTSCDAAKNQPKAHWVTHNPFFY